MMTSTTMTYAERSGVTVERREYREGPIGDEGERDIALTKGHELVQSNRIDLR